MLNNLFFCLNATVPIFIMMVLGMLFMHLNIFDEHFVSKMNSFVFKVALPVLIFYDLCTEKFYDVWDTGYVVFCFICTLLSIFLVCAVSFLLKDKSLQGEFIQVSYRSSAAILGIALIENIYGNAGMTPLMIVGAVPLYNIAAVTVLALFKPERDAINKKLMVKTLKDIVSNPIIIGVFLGLAWSLFRFPVPGMMDKAVSSVAHLATPLGLMSMGAAFNVKKASGSLKSAGVATLIKLIGLGLVFVPIAVFIGYRADKLVAILIMCCSSSTVSCYIMAKNMGHDGTLTGSTVMLTTFFSSFTLTIWLFALKTFNLL